MGVVARGGHLDLWVALLTPTSPVTTARRKRSCIRLE